MYGAANGQNNGCLQFDDASHLTYALGTVVTEYHYNNANKVTGVCTDAALSGLIVDTTSLNSFQPRAHIIKY